MSKEIFCTTAINTSSGESFRVSEKIVAESSEKISLSVKQGGKVTVSIEPMTKDEVSLLLITSNFPQSKKGELKYAFDSGKATTKLSKTILLMGNSLINELKSPKSIVFENTTEKDASIDVFIARTRCKEEELEKESTDNSKETESTDNSKETDKESKKRGLLGR